MKQNKTPNQKRTTTKMKINCPRQPKCTYCITAYKHNGIAKSINHALTVLFCVGAWFLNII